MATTPITPAYDLRPLGMGELLDYALRLYRSVFPSLGVAMLVLQGPFILPLYFLSVVINRAQLHAITDPQTSTVLSPDFADYLRLIYEYQGIDLLFLLNYSGTDWLLVALGALAVIVVASIATVLLQVGTVGVTGQRILGYQPGIRDLLRVFRRFGVRGIGAGIVQTLMLLVPMVPPVALLTLGFLQFNPNPTAGTALLITGFLLLMVMYVVLIWLTFVLMLVEPALVVEDLGVFAAIRRSFQLVQGHWWRIFGINLVLALLVQLVQSILGGIAGWVFPALLPGIELSLVVLTQTVLHVFLVPLTFVLQVLLYFDIRIRKEQFDLQFLLGQTAPAG